MKMQDMPQGQALSTEPILAIEHIQVASPQTGGDFGTSVLPVPRLVSEVISACDNAAASHSPVLHQCTSVHAEHVLHYLHQMFESSRVNSWQLHILCLLHCEVQDVLRSCPHCVESLHCDVGYNTHIAQRLHAYTRIDSTAFAAHLASHIII